MELDIKERLVLGAILPKEGNFLTLRLLRKLNEQLSFTDEELKKMKLRQDGDTVRWDETVVYTKDIDVGETMTNTIVETLKKMNDENKLTEDHFTLYEKFIENT